MQKSSQPNHRFFSGNRAALNSIQHALVNANEIRIATAYFEGSGFQALQESLSGRKIRLLVGRPEGGEDRLREVLDEFIRELSLGPMEKRTHAMRQMLAALEQGWMAVSIGKTEIMEPVWMDARYLYHHAKLYIADRSSVVVTSANFSYQGLCISREAGYTVTDSDDVNFFVEQFDQYFDVSRSVTQELINALRAWLQALDPYVIYARALLELYGLPDEAVPPRLPPLAEYQKGVVSSVLRSMTEYEGSFLVASTGLGKTIIAAHVAAYLRMQEQINTALVISPAGLREVWRRWIRSAHVSSEEFSHSTLTREDGDGNLPILEHELKQINEETLLIIDESHRLRNEDGKNREIRLSNERIQNAVRRNKAKVLLLTATPYGKDISEVQSQLNLLPAPVSDLSTSLGLSVEATSWQIDTLAQLTELPICTVLTTPDVVSHFGETDENGERFVRFGNDKRYFPRRIRLLTEKYNNPFDDLFADLLERKLLYKAVEPLGNDQQDALFDTSELVTNGQRLPLQEALLLHQFCSSPAEVVRIFEHLEKSKYSYDFANQKELNRFIRSNKKYLNEQKKPINDQKLGKLKNIILKNPQQKIVVFCEYIRTAKYVKEGLENILRGIKVDTTVDNSDLDSLLQRFAPIANDVLPEDQNIDAEIRVLIASRAISEGFNLQDASILVNYDLPWTVLQLAQRMGRILRPWHEPRDISIYNFVPSTMNNTRIKHARNWQERLRERSRQHHSLAQIPVMVYEDVKKGEIDKDYEMEKLGRELYLAKDSIAELDLDEVMKFISNVDDLTTSSFYNDLAQITNKEEIMQLPAGIRSAVKKNGKSRLFLLLRRNRNHLDTVIADQDGVALNESRSKDEVMKLIRCEPETPIATAEKYPSDDEFDSWIEGTRQKWARKHNLDPYKLQIVCALALLP